MEPLLKYALIFLLSLCLCLMPLSGFGARSTVAQQPSPPPQASPLPTAVTCDFACEGKKSYEAGLYNKAVAEWKAAADDYYSRSDLTNYAMALNNLALTYQKLGDWKSAQDWITKSIAQVRKISGDTATSVYAQALDIQGHIDFNQGRTQEALTTWQAAAKLYAKLKDTKLKDTEGTQINLLNQAQALQAIGFSTEAKAILEKLEKEPDTSSASPLKVRSLRSLSDAYQKSGRLTEAKGALERASTFLAAVELSQEQKEQEQIEISLAMANLTRYMAEQERDVEAAAEYQINPAYKSYNHNQPSYEKAQEALDQYSKVLEISQKKPNSLITLQTQINLLSLYRELNEESTALKMLPQVHELLKSIETKGKNFNEESVKNFNKENCKNINRETFNYINRDTVNARINIAQSLQFFSLANQPNIARVIDLKEYLQVASCQAKELKDIPTQSYALGILGRFYELKENWDEAQDSTEQALQLSRSVNVPNVTYLWQWQLGRILRSQGNPEQAKASYRSAIATLETVRQDLSGTAADSQFSFRDDAEPIYRELVDLLLPKDKKEVSQEDLWEAVQKIDSLQVAELNDYFRCLVGQPIPVEKVSEKLGKQDNKTAIIYTIILNNRLEVIIRLPGGNDLIRETSLIQQSDLETLIAQYSNELPKLDASADEYNQFSMLIYQHLVQKIELHLAQSDVKNLVFLLDGSLRRVPLSALWDGQKYLVEKYAISVTPSLSLLNANPIKTKNFRTLFAGLTVDHPVAKIATNQQKKEEDSLKKQVEEELKLMNSVLKSEMITLVNTDFTPSKLEQKLENSDFQIIHLSTHGYFGSRNENTYIVTASKEGEIINLDRLRYLVRKGKQNRQSAMQLLVMSACSTATGDRRATLGMAGAAVRSGADSTIATLWQVDADGTAQFMKMFYEELKKAVATGKTKAEALQQAQIRFLEKGRSKESGLEYMERPSYWAPFILLGSWL